MTRPELGRPLRDMEASAPVGLHNRVVHVRVMLRPKDAGMDPHRDSINLKYDRTILTSSLKPPEFFVKLMSGQDATPARGPYERGEILVPKVNGRIVVKGPNARGEEVRAVHGVRPGDVASLTLVADYITTRNDGQPASDEDRDSARKSMVVHTTRAALPGATINCYADRLVWPENAPRTPGSRRATEDSNSKVHVEGKMVKKASVKGGAGDKKLYGRDEKGDDGRVLSSERGASMRPTDTSAKWTGHAVEEPDKAESASCSNCGDTRELLWFFYGGKQRRVVVMDHMIGKGRCKKDPKKPRGVFTPTNKSVKTITKDGLFKAVKTEARKVSSQASGGK